MSAWRRRWLWLSALLSMTALAGCAQNAPPPSSAPTQSDASPAGASMNAPGEPAADFSPGDGSMEEAEASPPPAPASGGATNSDDSRQARKSTRDEGVARPQPEDRPGLGTTWGETRESRITTVPFVRGDASTPFATASLFYNDREGARAMTASSGFRAIADGRIRTASGVVTIGLKSERGAFLNGMTNGERDYVIGEAGERYSIVITNHAPSRVEVVVSVDGLDVLNGKKASFRSRGYLVEANAQIEIDGWRQSEDSVAAFRFGSVRGSYAGKKHGDTRNVGVIGVALFNERGTNPQPWTQREIDTRNNANPFPGQFATPP